MSKSPEQVVAEALDEMTGHFLMNFAVEWCGAGQPRLSDQEVARMGRHLMAQQKKAKLFLERLRREFVPEVKAPIPVTSPNGQPLRK